VKTQIVLPLSRFYASSAALRRRTAGAARLLVDLVYPARCVHCGRPGQLLCDRCLSEAPRLGRSVCRRCAQPLAIPSLCGSCAFDPAVLSTTLAVFQFGGAIRAAIHALKYSDLRSIAPVLGALLTTDPRFAELEADIVVPVPLHRKRLRTRGYNQSELIGRVVARRLGIDMSTGMLRRLVDTPPQARARSRTERAAGVRDAFRAGEGAPGRRILLVDDVTTTGSTLRECARSLLKAGATRVDAIVVAREV